MKQFSIIIPCYNSSSTLEKAVLSIEKYFHSYSYEIIIVDDGSDDDDGILQDKYKDRRNVVFLAQENKGVSSARNKALDIAQGKYICFLDADDIFFDFDVHQIIQEFEKGSELISFGYDVFSLSDVLVESVRPEQTRHAVPKEIIYHEVVRSQSVGGHVTKKVFLNSIIQEYHLRFRENIHYTEDLVFVVEYLDRIQTVSTFEISMYHLFVHESSIRGSVKKPTKKQLLKLASVVEANQYIAGSKLDEQSKNFFGAESFYTFFSLLQKSRQFHDDDLNEKMRGFKLKIRSEVGTFLFYRKTRFSMIQRIIGFYRYLRY